MAENAPLTLGVIPCAHGSTTSSDGTVDCRRDETAPAFHGNYANWIRQNPGKFEVVQHGATHDSNERLANFSREKQLEIMSTGLDRMATWNLPGGQPVTFNAPFASANQDTVSVAEQLGFQALVKASRTFSLQSDQLEIFTYPVFPCKTNSNGQPVDGPECELHRPPDLVRMVKDRSEELKANGQDGTVVVMYHVQDVLLSTTPGDPNRDKVDPDKIAELRQLLRAFRAEELNGTFDLTTFAQLVGVSPVEGTSAPIDFDADLVTDVAVFRPSTGTWFVDGNHDGVTDWRLRYGTSGDIPVPGDYDGDGVLDVAVYRPSTGHWFVDTVRDGASNLRIRYGTQGDIPVPGDYDGDGLVDFAVFRPSAGAWFVDWDRKGSSDRRVRYGENGDVPFTADFDGDGLADLIIFRPSTGGWFVDTNLDGASDFRTRYGMNGDIPVPGDYNGDGAIDPAVFRPSTGQWFIDLDRNARSDVVVVYGTNGDVPTPGDFDGNGTTDLAVFRPSTGTWFVDLDLNGTTEKRVRYGTNGDVPLRLHGWSLDAAGVMP